MKYDHLKTLISWRSILLSLLLVLGLNSVWAQTTSALDHVKTGFALTGSHIKQRCESCHVNGTFKGTPKDCASCHTAGARLAINNIVKTQSHFPTTATCDTCHNSLTFTGAKFHRSTFVNSQCATCHLTAIYEQTSKPNTPTHMGVTGNCESCHKSTASWLTGAKPDHSLFTIATNCVTCHFTGGSGLGKPGNHMPTLLNCASCHSATFATFTPNSWNHTQMPVTSQCSTCHTGGYLTGLGKTSNHIPYQVLTGVVITNCDSCHQAGYISWFPGLFHKNVSVSTQCATCHLSTIYGLTGKPNTATHATVTGNCESCHKTTLSWASTRPDHSLFTVATVCTSCHDNTTALGKPATHMPTALNCISCHSATLATFTPNSWNHTQMPVASVCSTCHTGTYLTGLGKTSNHIPYQVLTGVVITNCDSCHKAGYVGWFPGQFHKNVTISTQCATCHLSSIYGLTAKPADSTHSTITTNCESCHSNPAVAWSSATFAHSAANAVGTGTCDTCHGVVGATPPNAMGKPLTHIPVPVGVAKCDSCHTSQSTFLTYTMNHSVVTTATCKSCHNGSYTTQGTQGALAMPTTHIPLTSLFNGATLDCNACHSSTASFLTEKMNHNGTTGAGVGMCTGCHASGLKYLGNQQTKSLTHKSTGKPDCSTSGCHKPIGNTGSTYTNWGG